MKSLAGGVVEIRRRFQIASSASMSPALSPTRGSLARAPPGRASVRGSSLGSISGETSAVLSVGPQASTVKSPSASAGDHMRAAVDRRRAVRKGVRSVMSASFPEPWVIANRSIRGDSRYLAVRGHRREHPLHPPDLGGLIHLDVG